MSPIAVVAWGCQGLLETSGAILAHRKRLRILSALLAWRALMDLVTGAIYAAHRPSYAVVMWVGRAVQYAILYALGIQLAAKMVQEYRPLTQYIYKTLAMVASVATYIFVTTELWERKFLHAEAVSSLLLLAVVLLGWIGKKKGLEEPWKLITVGLCISTAGASLCALMATYSSRYLSLYPLPAISALLIWNLSILPRKPNKAEEQLEDQKFKPVGVKIPKMQSRRVN